MNPRYAVGTRVRVGQRETTTHCRTPSYLRGKRGTIVRVLGTFPDPEKLAYHHVGLPHRALYQVEFDFAEVWGGVDERTRIAADLYEHWLEAE